MVPVARAGPATDKGEWMASGIGSWGVYLPFWRLERKAIGQALGCAGRAGGADGRLLRRGHHDARGGGGSSGPSALAGAGAGRSCSSPPPSPPTRTRPTPPPSTPPWASPSGPAPTTWSGSVRSAVAALTALAAGRDHPTLAVISELRTGLAGGCRRAGVGRRRRGLRLRARRGGGRAHGAGLGHRGVPRPVAGTRRAELPAVGGALRRAGLRPAGPGRLHRRPEVGGHHRRRPSTIWWSPACTPGPCGPSRPRSGVAEAVVPDHSTSQSATSGPPSSVWAWPTCSSGPRPVRSSSPCSWPTGPTPWCGGPPTRSPAVQAARREAGLATRGRAGGRRAAPISPTPRS